MLRSREKREEKKAERKAKRGSKVAGEREAAVLNSLSDHSELEDLGRDLGTIRSVGADPKSFEAEDEPFEMAESTGPAPELEAHPDYYTENVGGDVLADPVGVDLSFAYDKNKTASGATFGTPRSESDRAMKQDKYDRENDPEYQEASAEFIGDVERGIAEREFTSEIERDFPVEKQQEEQEEETGGYTHRGYLGNRLAEQNMIDKIRAQRRVVNDMIKQADTPEELESIQDEMKELDDLRKDHSDHIKSKRDFRKQRKAVKRQAQGRRPAQTRENIFTPDEPAEEVAEEKEEVTALPDTKEVARRAMAPAPAPPPRPGPVGGTTGMEQDESGDFVDTDQVSTVSNEDLNLDEFGNPIQSYEDEADLVKDYGESIEPVEGDPISEYMQDFESYPAPGGTAKMGGNAKQIIRDQIVELTGSDELMSGIFRSDGTIDTAAITDLVKREEISQDDAARILELVGQVSPASVDAITLSSDRKLEDVGR